ncbi:MAG: 4Fe-4S binding protein [Desulfarculaceae bacterium]|jgi:2-oxoacid:acceptor oxidoreductase delta subunit (pyruvate/2-ketoisovalerate family)
MNKITLGAVVAGGSSLDYPTGNWRDQRPLIDQKKCKQCGICQEVCPDDAVRFADETFEIDYNYCKGCGLCAHECVVQAITMVPEEK